MKTKIILSVNKEGQDISGVISEKVWGEKVENDIYRIINIPFYAFGYSLNDEVYAPDLNTPIGFNDVVNYSNNSTVLVLVMNTSRQHIYINFATHWGVDYESAISRKSFVISIPFNIDLEKMVSELGVITSKNGDGFLITSQRHYSNNDIFY